MANGFNALVPDIGGRFAEGQAQQLGVQQARQNLLSGQQQLQQTRREAPLRNALLDLRLEGARQQQKRDVTRSGQQQALQRATIVNQSARALKGLPFQQRQAALQALTPRLSEFGVDPSAFQGQELSDVNLDNAIAATQGIIQSPEQGLQNLRLQLEKQRTATQREGLALREREIDISEQREQRARGKLSASLENSLLESQDRTVAAQQSANQYDVLAGDFERLRLQGGLASTFTESLKSILGTQDDVTEFRRQFNKVRLSEGLKNLPPGPATDRDVKEAFKGVPKENASAEQIAEFLRGAARLARIEAGFNQFKSDFISENSTAKGLLREWRTSFNSPVLNREVSTAEIYETAENRGVTPEEVRQRLGL